VPRFPARILAAVQERREPVSQPRLLAAESRGQPVPLRLGEEVVLPRAGDRELSCGVIRHDLRTPAAAVFPPDGSAAYSSASRRRRSA
jgi:hypothetical protein